MRPPRACEVIYITQRNRIIVVRKHNDRNGWARCNRRFKVKFGTGDQDQVDPGRHQVHCRSERSWRLLVGASMLNQQVLAARKAELSQLIDERCIARGYHRIIQSGTQVAHARDRGRLLPTARPLLYQEQ